MPTVPLQSACGPSENTNTSLFPEGTGYADSKIYIETRTNKNRQKISAWEEVTGHPHPQRRLHSGPRRDQVDSASVDRKVDKENCALDTMIVALLEEKRKLWHMLQQG